MRTAIFQAALLCALLAAAARAHVGSPDIYLDGKAGPYQLFVTVRTPSVIPGVAELEIRSQAAGVSGMDAVPLPMAGAGAKFAPVPDKLKVSPQDPQLFSGALWMMEPGSWQVRITVDGAQGRGVLAVPIPAAATSTKRMQPGLGALLSLLGMFLVGGVVAMAGASVREARLEPGVKPAGPRVRAGRVAMMVALLIVLAALWGGNEWWKSEASSYGQEVYKPIRMRAALAPPGRLTLNLSDPGWLEGPYWRRIFTRSVDDLVPDHNHLMHLYALREPGLDVVYHLHPEMSGSGVFALDLPGMPAGRYRLYADVVHANGFPETLVSEIAVPAGSGRALAGDDAGGSAGTWQSSPATSTEFTLPDGYRLQWVPPAGGLHPKTPVLFRFRLLKPDGSAPRDMALYMGMPGHAAFVKTDGTVFAHVHPTGSVSMAALMLAQSSTSAGSSAGQSGASQMTGMDMSGDSGRALPSEVTFPWGFPSAGRYRVIVQVKHGETIETGIFDAAVT